jgi:membrane-associated phospholipid phosphatase
MKPADALTMGFLLCLTALSLVFYNRIPGVKTLIGSYCILFFIQAFLTKNEAVLRRSRGMDLIARVVFPVVCVLVLFDSFGGLVHALNPKDIDPLLIRLDYLLFGGFPTVMLESVQSPLLTDLLQVAYSTYYVLPISLGLLLKLQKRDAEFDRTVFLLLLCFYLSYVGYLLFPALGPRYTMHHLQSSDLQGLFIAEPIQRILNDLEGIKRDAFPSGHTGVALVVSALAWRFHRGFFFTTLPAIVMLIVATVYCRYHYVVDVIGGVVLAVLTLVLGERYYGYWEIRNTLNR